MITQSNHRLTGTCMLALFSLLFATPLQAAKKPPVYSMGPTGVYGEFFPGWPHVATSFRVASVEKGSPADGKINPGDLIVGIGSEKFVGDPRHGLGAAIDTAETESSGGKLTLLLEGGKQVVITLPVLGTYSATAPYNCAKSEKIIDQAIEGILKNPRIGDSPTRADLLGLMATGEKQHIETVAKLIKEKKLLDVDPAKAEGFLSGAIKDNGSVTAGWGWGYNLITLGEYYLLTKDESVMPMIRTYALGLARGQDASGCWGHRMMTADSGNRLPGYAQMNQPSLSNFMGMIIARKCGIKDPILDKAIERTNAYVADHVGKGTFPYGVAGPNRSQFNNNGMSGSAAICMSLMGNKEGARFFSHCSATSYDWLTSGHANTFFNPLWTSLGAAFAGPEVTHEYFKRSLWYYNGIRSWKGGFPGSNGTAGVYNGQALLFYCVPRKALLITGREADPSVWAKGKEVMDVINLIKLSNSSMSADALIDVLKMESPYPQVPTQVASIFMERTHQYKRAKKDDDFTDKIMALIKTGSARQKSDALWCFGGRCHIDFSARHLPDLGAVLRDKSNPLFVRVAAAKAVGSGNFKEAAYPYYNDVLALLFENRTEPDPFNHTDVRISEALDGICTEPFKANLVTDKDLFYNAALKMLAHKRQWGRFTGIKMLRGMPLEDFPLVGKELMVAVENKNPTYQSYHNVQDSVAPGVEVLAGLKIKEGLDILLDTILHSEGKWGFKQKMLYYALPLYKGNAKPYIHKFEQHPNIAKGKTSDGWQNLVKAIEADENPEKLITLAEALRVNMNR